MSSSSVPGTAEGSLAIEEDATMTKPRPRRAYRTPRYPTRLQVRADPELLARHMPLGWRTAAGAAGLLAFVTATGAAGAAVDASVPGPDDGMSLVAPLFEHGEGRGAVGCIIVAPPVFLSEEEALLIIREELSEHGVELSEEGHVRQDVTFSRREWAHVGEGDRPDDWQLRPIPGTEAPLEFDLRDPERRIAVEFVSVEDAPVFGKPEPDSSVDEFDLRGLAGDAAEKVGAAGGEDHVAFFYDPMEVSRPRGGWLDTEDAERRQRAEEELEAVESPRERARRMLRMQVMDFVEWLQAQGVI
jgi:hypothetical protein